MAKRHGKIYRSVSPRTRQLGRHLGLSDSYQEYRNDRAENNLRRRKGLIHARINNRERARKRGM